MGTRAIIHILDESGANLVTIYRQMDGDPRWLGAAIKATLGDKQIVNGYSNPDTQCNGIGCAAAMLIASLKGGCGNVYIYPVGSHDCGEEFVYTLNEYRERIHLHVAYAGGATIYSGPLADFDPTAQHIHAA